MRLLIITWTTECTTTNLSMESEPGNCPLKESVFVSLREYSCLVALILIEETAEQSDCPLYRLHHIFRVSRSHPSYRTPSPCHFGFHFRLVLCIVRYERVNYLAYSSLARHTRESERPSACVCEYCRSSVVREALNTGACPRAKGV